MRHREAQVWPAYLRHARALDERHSAPGTTAIADRLRWFTPTRGLVLVGAFGEASDVASDGRRHDVHDLMLSLTHLGGAEAGWRLSGARSASEMRSFIVSRARRRVGLAGVQAMARHRISRFPYIHRRATGDG